MKLTFTLAALLYPFSVLANISDFEAIARAKAALEVLEPAALKYPPTVTRSDEDHSDLDRVLVHFGESTVGLTPTGEFRHYYTNDKSAYLGKGDVVDFHKTDDEAWAAFVTAIGKVMPAGDFSDRDLVRSTSPRTDYVYRFAMKPRPHGYRATGNGVYGSIHRSTGRLMSVSIATGWTYEEPRIEFTAEEVKVFASEKYGGKPGDWATLLEFRSFGRGEMFRVPAHTLRMNEQKIVRLHYQVGRKGFATWIDTVTGDEVDVAIIDGPGYEEFYEVLEARGLTGLRSTTSRTPVIAVTAGAVFLVAVLSYRMFRRRRMNAA